MFEPKDEWVKNHSRQREQQGENPGCRTFLSIFIGQMGPAWPQCRVWEQEACEPEGQSSVGHIRSPIWYCENAFMLSVTAAASITCSVIFSIKVYKVGTLLECSFDVLHLVVSQVALAWSFISPFISAVKSLVHSRNFHNYFSRRFSS
jgi:hypothetical protein